MKIELPLVLLLVAIAAAGGVDLVLDAPASWLSPHVAYEVFVIAATLSTAGWLWRRWRWATLANRALEAIVATRQAERDAWREHAEAALAGLATAINRQLDLWALTPAEREVVLLLLKGRSHREIALASGRSERTIRQHAAAAYQKAGVAGRAELAAFFLNDLPLAARDGP